MLSAHQLSKSYNIHKILEDVTFSINPGERVGLIGPNGCGKTTLFRILAGEEQPDSGVVSFTPSNLRLGYLPQGFDPPQDLTIKTLFQQTAADPEILEDEVVRLADQLAKNPHDLQVQQAYDEILTQIGRAHV